MRAPTLTAAFLAAGGTLLLIVAVFRPALEGAGPFKTLESVTLGLVIGMLPAYLLVLWLSAWAAYRTRAVVPQRMQTIAFTSLSVVAAVLTFLAPLMPSAFLAAACLSDVLCPSVANPVLWSYLQLITSLPIAPSLVGLIVVVLAATLSRTRRFTNEA
jgi:magnesium-transporting ATPase (P-type)